MTKLKQVEIKGTLVKGKDLDKEEIEVMMSMLLECAKKRKKARELADKAKEMEQEANELLEPIMKSCSISSVVVGNVGVLGYSGLSRSSFNKNKAMELLVDSGVDADLVSEVWKQSTKKSKKKGVVRFMLEKKEG